MPVEFKAWACDDDACSYMGSKSEVEDHERVFRHHNPLRCKNQDHDDCFDAQLRNIEEA